MIEARPNERTNKLSRRCVCFCAARGDGLWWLRLAPKSLQRLLFVTAAAALVAAVAGLEGRVVFVAFRRYLRLPAPWSWLLVSVALYGLAALVTAHLLGAIGPQVRRRRRKRAREREREGTWRAHT